MTEHGESARGEAESPSAERGRRGAGRDRGRADARLRSHDLQLDERSKAIIEALQHDGRRSYADIAKEVGLSEAAVRQRVAKLVENGTMQIVAVTNPMQLGFQRQAMLGLQVTGDLAPLADEICGMEQVDYVVAAAGTYDLLVEVVCEDDEELLALLGRIRTLPQVLRTEVMTYLKLWDQRYNWGTR